MSLAAARVLGKPDPPRWWMLCLSLAQGLVLLWLWRAGDAEAWPSQTPALNYPFWALAIVWPGMLLFCMDAGNRLRTLASTSAFAAVVALSAVYLGWAASPFGEFPVFALVERGVVSLLLACFLAALFLQSWAGRHRITYGTLFALSWRNFLVASLATLAVLVFYGVLVVWGELFSAIGIPLFADVFQEDWFLFPVLALALGLAIDIFRRLVTLIDGIGGLLEGLLRLLLPLSVCVQTAFLITLPATGLAPLWDTGSGTFWLLCLTGFVLFATNAVYQPDINVPYPAVVHRVLCVGIALSPAIPALAAYGLYLRIAQYGWSVERCWAVTVCAFFGMYAVGYAWRIVRTREAWPSGLGGLNIAMASVLLAVLLLVNSPLLDFRSISMASQWHHVERGEVAIEDFDFYYAKTYLARPAWLKTQEVIAKYETADPEVAQEIRRSLGRRPGDKGVEWWRVTYRPESLVVPVEVKAAVDSLLEDNWGANVSFGTYSRDHVQMLIRFDLNADGKEDYIFVSAGPLVAAAHVYAADDGAWKVAVLAPRKRLPQGTDLSTMLRSGALSSEDRAVRDFKVGDLVLGHHHDYEKRRSGIWSAFRERED